MERYDANIHQCPLRILLAMSTAALLLFTVALLLLG